MAQKKFIDASSPADMSTLNLNLRHLQAFAAVAATGSVTRAGEVLFRVASAITRAIAELEHSLGTPLFERKSRGMLRNTFGDAVLARTQRIESEFTLACAELTGSEPGPAAGKSRLEARTLQAALFNGRRLAVFASLAEMENMPAAARAYGITQPAISTLVRELEALCGRQLFVRSPRGVTPTRAGTALAFRFKRVLAELRSIDSDIAAIAGLVQGSVIVGALPLGRTLLLPSAIAALVSRHPGLHVSTVESPYEVLAAALRSGAVDFILGALRPDDDTPDLVQDTLFNDRLSLVVRAGHPLTKAGSVKADDLARAQWVLSRPGTPLRELLEKSLSHRQLPSPVPRVETADLAILRGLLLQSDMVTAISAHQLHYEIAAGTLVVLDFPLPLTQRRIGMAQRRGALPSAGVRALMDQIHALTPGMQALGDGPAA